MSLLRDKTILCITDTHLGINFPDKRLEESLALFLDVVEAYKPDHIVHLGDCFHTKRPSGNLIEYATWFFMALSTLAPVTILAGGHDQDAHDEVTAIDFLDDISSTIEVVTKPEIRDGGYICVAPYMRRIPQAVLKTLAQSKINFIHQGIVESPLDSTNRTYGLMPDAVPLECLKDTFTVCGHIHTPWVNNDENVIVLGSPYQTQYRHSICNRGALYFNAADPHHTAEFIPINSFKLKRSIIEILEIENDPIESVIKKLPVREDNTYYDILVAIEGERKHTITNDIKITVQNIYGENLDKIQISMVLPREHRSAYSNLKVLSSSIQDKDPQQLFQLWAEVRTDAFFKSRPELFKKCQLELASIIQEVDVHNASNA